MVGRLNRKLRGWANYFDLGAVSRAYDAVNYHVTNRLRRWLCRKHKVRGQGYSRYPDRYLYRELGLYQLSAPAGDFPMRPCEKLGYNSLCPRAGCLNRARPVR